MNWATADGKIINYKDIPHQHWSNIYWYHLLFQEVPGVNKFLMERNCMIAATEINKMFGGKTLPYEPTYSYEIEWLDKLDLLRGNYIFNRQGVLIGEINPSKVKHFELQIV